MTSRRIDTTFAEVSYEGIAFPVVENFVTNWGHDKAMHQGLRTPGADIQTTGRQPLQIQFKIAFLNDINGWPVDPPLYPDTYDSLMRRFREIPIGTLSHPTYGDLTVHVDSVQEHIDPKVSNGFFVDVHCTEKTDPAFVFADQPNSEVQQESPVDSVQSAAAQSDGIMPLTTEQPFVLMVPVIGNLLVSVDSGVVSPLVAATAFSQALTAVAANITSAIALGIPGHEYRVAAEACLASVYRFQDEYTSSRKVRYVTLPAPMSLARAAALPNVYGDSRKAYLLRQNNVIPDPTSIPAGTVLVVIPSN